MLPSLQRIRPILRRRRWTLSAPRSATVAGRRRVSAELLGEPVWFETADVPLDAAPEAFAGLCLIPALHHRATVDVPCPLDADWCSRTARLVPVFARWWGYPDTYPIAALPDERPRFAPSGRTALCFSGGVDSFNSLLCGNHRADFLVLVHGFDIALDDQRRMDAAEQSVRRVAAATGKQLIVLRTNVREHHLLRRVSWDRLHGAALAAAGHVLSGLVDRLVIPSSWSYAHRVPWGSHWQTDRFWSSGSLEVVHDDATKSRYQRVVAVGRHPLVHEHLRVCWKNDAPTGNCSRCEKCVRTMVALAACGQLAASRVFDVQTPLPDLIRSLSVPRLIHPLWRSLLALDLDPDVKAAIHGVLAPPPPPRWFRKRRPTAGTR